MGTDFCNPSTEEAKAAATLSDYDSIFSFSDLWGDAGDSDGDGAGEGGGMSEDLKVISNKTHEIVYEGDDEEEVFEEPRMRKAYYINDDTIKNDEGETFQIYRSPDTRARGITEVEVEDDIETWLCKSNVNKSPSVKNKSEVSKTFSDFASRNLEYYDKEKEEAKSIERPNHEITEVEDDVDTWLCKSSVNKSSRKDKTVSRPQPTILGWEGYNSKKSKKSNLREAKREVRRYYIRPQNVFCANKLDIIKALIEIGDANCSVYTLNNLEDNNEVNKLTNKDIIYYYDDGILYDKNHVRVMDYDLYVKREEKRDRIDVDVVSDEKFDKTYEDRITEQSEFDLDFDNLDEDLKDSGRNGSDKFCCICGEPLEGYGNDPWPVKEEGQCCDACNDKFVIPARLDFYK